MTAPDYFFLIFAATIILIRLILFPRKGHSPTIYGIRLHHYMYGFALVVLSLIFSNLALYAIGLGLFVDELPQALTRKLVYGWDVYYSPSMLFGVLFIVILVYIFRNQIVSVI